MMDNASGSNISSGFLRTKISLKGNQSQLSLVSPFYGMKPELPQTSQLLGSEDLISLFDLSGPYSRYCGARKPKDDLASFLPHVCGSAQINRKADTSCSLRQIIEKPPIVGREINNLSASQMVGFKLAPGPVSDSNRYFDLVDIPMEVSSISQAPSGLEKNMEMDGKRGKRVKRSLDEMEVTAADGERKNKKHKGEDREKEKKKKKKDKKKKKEKEREKKNAEEEHKKSHDGRKDVVNTPFF